MAQNLNMDNTNYTKMFTLITQVLTVLTLDSFARRRSKLISLYNIYLYEYVYVKTFCTQLSQVKSKLSILSLNIRTINTKFDKLKIILDDINQHHQISVICLKETQLDENDSTLSFELNDYQLISKGM